MKDGLFFTAAAALDIQVKMKPLTATESLAMPQNPGGAVPSFSEYSFLGALVLNLTCRSSVGRLSLTPPESFKGVHLFFSSKTCTSGAHIFVDCKVCAI